ncbi:MAG: hypothetical protein ACOC0P_05860, partial [Planctomycetota bacterium]
MTDDHTIRHAENASRRQSVLRRGVARSTSSIGGRRERGSVLILVVGVLVLLAISATVYVSVGRMERLQSTAQESFVVRDEAAAKIVAHLGDVIALDLFGNDPSAEKPFLDGERWDYPYTAPGDEDAFGTQADPWLASTQPVAPLSAGVNARETEAWTTWPHFSNVHPQGRFVALDRLVNRDGIYSTDLFIPAQPRSLDTRDIWSGEDQRELRFDLQVDDIDQTSTGYVTMADRVLGTDTDGDGRIDARWTEMPDLYGLPDGMRMFFATRIIDLSSALNVNTSVETGLTAVSGPGGSPSVGTGRYPSDIDLYSMLFDEYFNISRFRGYSVARNELERRFFVPDGFSEHLKSLGVFDETYPPTSYTADQRTPEERRSSIFTSFGREGSGANPERLAYSTSDEIDLRSFWGVSNDRATSLLELRFTELNGADPENPAAWLSPLRDLFPTQLDWATDEPTFLDLRTDVRRLISTYNGSRPVRPWNLEDPEDDLVGHDLLLKHRLDRILADGPNLSNQQALLSGLMWSLAPYAVRHTESTSGQQLNVFYDDRNNPMPEHIARWNPPSSDYVLHYGGGDATFAFIRSAMVATNAQDWADSDSDPSIRRLRFSAADPETNPLDQDGWEMAASFEFGRLPDGVVINQNPVALIGLERQPFLRGVSTLAI